MTTKPKWAQAESVIRENSSIIFYSLDHPRVPSEFIREIRSGMKAGFEDFFLDFDNVQRIFPNGCAPISGLIKYYQGLPNIDLICDNVPLVIEQTNLLDPLFAIDHQKKMHRNVLNRVWRFGSDEGIHLLVNSFLDELSKQDTFEKGVLNALEWSLNEVMDNVLQHSQCSCGYAMGQIHERTKHIAFTMYPSYQAIFPGKI